MFHLLVPLSCCSSPSTVPFFGLNFLRNHPFFPPPMFRKIPFLLSPNRRICLFWPHFFFSICLGPYFLATNLCPPAKAMMFHLLVPLSCCSSPSTVPFFGLNFLRNHPFFPPPMF